MTAAISATRSVSEWQNTTGRTHPAPDAAFVAGVAAYRRHPYARDLRDPPTIWSEGDSRVLDYGGEGPVVLAVPSLINRAYVLDLAPGRSMLRTMASLGVHPLLLDWGWPGTLERRFDLTDYIAGRLERAIAAVSEPVVLMGYCMGGLLALAAALRQPDRVRALMLLATPWDFAAGRLNHHPMAWTAENLAPLSSGRALPIDAIQTMFAMADPVGVVLKYRAFAGLDQNSERAEMFVAIEDWLADGVPLAAPVAMECLCGWYGDNAPGLGRWRVAGARVHPEALRVPTLIALPARDRIVPPESARPLTRLIRRATVLNLAAGHVGMVAGSQAREQLWEPAMDWLRSL